MYLPACHGRVVHGKRRAWVCLSAELPVPRCVSLCPALQENVLVPAGPATGWLSVRVLRGVEHSLVPVCPACLWLGRDSGARTGDTNSSVVQTPECFSAKQSAALHCTECSPSAATASCASILLSPTFRGGCKNISCMPRNHCLRCRCLLGSGLEVPYAGLAASAWLAAVPGHSHPSEVGAQRAPLLESSDQETPMGR